MGGGDAYTCEEDMMNDDERRGSGGGEGARVRCLYLCFEEIIPHKGVPSHTDARVPFGNRSQSRDSSSIVPPDWISPFSLRLHPSFQPPSSRFPCLLSVARFCGGCCLLFRPQRFRVLGKRAGGIALSAVFSRPRSDAHTIRHRMLAICSKTVLNIVHTDIPLFLSYRV